MKKITTTRIVYLWGKGTTLRDSFTNAWWSGFRAEREGLERTAPARFSEKEVEAFKSGYDYRKDTYADDK